MAFGIDFGTSNSVISYWDPDRGTARALELDAVPPDWRGLSLEYVLPSVLSYFNGGYVYGFAAKHGFGEPLSAVKRLLLSDSPELLGDHDFPPTVLSAAILREIVDRARDNGAVVADAVVSVPANATGRQRQRTRQAAKLAGITPLRLMNEPTAAALAFVHLISDIEQRDGSYLVFDWGGGTLDVTILEHSGGIFQEIESEGIPELGGFDLDARLLAILAEKFHVEPNALRAEISPAELERHKISLCSSDRVDVVAVGKVATVTGQEFQSACADLLLQATELVSRVTSRYGEELDYLVPVGGTSRIPWVAEALQATTGLGTPSLSAFNPMTAVADGAAIAAAIEMGEVQDRLFTVTANDLGLVTHTADAQEEVFSAIIRRGVSIPYAHRRRFKKNRKGPVHLRIVEGIANGAFSEGDHATVELLRSPEPSGADESFFVELSYDRDALLEISLFSTSGETLLRHEFGLVDATTPEEHQELLKELGRPPAVSPQPQPQPSISPEAHTVAEPLKGEVDAEEALQSEEALRPYSVIIDGSNLAHAIARGGQSQLSYEDLKLAVSEFVTYLTQEGLAAEDMEVLCIVDATFRHKTAPEELAAIASAVSSAELIQSPAGYNGRADKLILQLAKRRATKSVVVLILSNDVFRNYASEYGSYFGAAEGDFVPGRIFRHSVTSVGAELIFGRSDGPRAHPQPTTGKSSRPRPQPGVPSRNRYEPPMPTDDWWRYK